MKTVVVTLCDKGYIEKATQTISELRTVGQWDGDVVLLAVDCPPLRLPSVEVLEVSHLPTEGLLRAYADFPFQGGDGRHLTRLTQWDKLHVFAPTFKRWERVLFLDAGMRILSPIRPLLELDCTGRLLAPDDGEYPPNPEVRFHRLVDPGNPTAYERLLQEFGPDVLQSRCFLNGIFLYDTALLDRIPMTELVETMNTYPIARCNEMTVMNIVFGARHKVWSPMPKRLGATYSFGYNESGQNGTPGHWRDFVCMKYPFWTPPKVVGDKDTAVVTLCDAGYFSKAKKTLREVREVGGWAGDLVLIAIDFDPEPIPGVTVISLPHLDTSGLVASLRAHPLQPQPDNRHLGKLYQWDKLQVFRTEFAAWKRIVFLDAGIRVCNSLEPLLSLPWQGSFLAPDDSDPYDNGRRFGVQLDLSANPEATERLFQDFPRSLLTRPYFLNCMFVFDTALLSRVTYRDLTEAMNAYPICMCNEMGILNLMFTFKLGVWKPFPQRVGSRYLFGWTEANYRECPPASSFHFLKYSFTG